MRLLCKKNFNGVVKNDDVKQGEVVHIQPIILWYVSKKINSCDRIDIDSFSLKKHFMIYDDLEYKDTKTAFETMIIMDCSNSEKEFLDNIENYIKTRRKQLCKTEDIRQEQRGTTERHTTK